MQDGKEKMGGVYRLGMLQPSFQHSQFQDVIGLFVQQHIGYRHSSVCSLFLYFLFYLFLKTVNIYFPLVEQFPYRSRFLSQEGKHNMLGSH